MDNLSLAVLSTTMIKHDPVTNCYAQWGCTYKLLAALAPYLNATTLNRLVGVFGSYGMNYQVIPYATAAVRAQLAQMPVPAPYAHSAAWHAVDGGAEIWPNQTEEELFLLNWTSPNGDATAQTAAVHAHRYMRVVLKDETDLALLAIVIGGMIAIVSIMFTTDPQDVTTHANNWADAMFGKNGDGTTATEDGSIWIPLPMDHGGGYDPYYGSAPSSGPPPIPNASPPYSGEQPTGEAPNDSEELSGGYNFCWEGSAGGGC